MLNNLPKLVTKRPKRLGRGYGSGKGGHTVGRGQKGQKSRNSVAIWFEGGQLPIIRRTPFLKGKYRFKSLNDKPYRVSLSLLNHFADGDLVDLETLQKTLKINQKALAAGAKVLNLGKLERSNLKIALPTSQSAKQALAKNNCELVE